MCRNEARRPPTDDRNGIHRGKLAVCSTRIFHPMKARHMPALAGLALIACNGPEPADEVAAVRACYTEYFTALREGDGQGAAQLVDSRTVAYYDSMLVLAREADSLRVAQLPLMDRITVLGMRLRGTPQVLGSMNGRGALAFAIDQGMMGSMGIEGLDLGTIGVDGDVAQAPLTMHGFPTPASFMFHREDGRWHIDITSLFGLSRVALDHLATSRGAAAEALLMELVTGDATAQLPGSVWHPTQ